MGIADVIPGVSGGTMALVLGIYRELITALGSLDLVWVFHCVRNIGRGTRAFTGTVLAEMRRLKAIFFLILGAGIFTALSIGGAVIPPVLESYPAIVRAAFFGLILGSVHVPARAIQSRSFRRLIPAIVFLIVLFTVGWLVTGHGASGSAGPRIWVEVESSGQPLEQLLFEQYSSGTVSEVLGRQENQHLFSDDEKTSAETYVSAGDNVLIPRSPHWFVFVSGALAISAMILPGISGAYILLILSSYTFVLNLLHLFNSRLAAGRQPGGEILYLIIFVSGMLIGIVTISRLLKYLLTNYNDYTMAGLIGFMLGCLRGIWPWRWLPEEATTLASIRLLAIMVLAVIFVWGLDYLTDGETAPVQAGR